VILDEEYLWYSLASSEEEGGMGGGMAHLALCDCENPIEDEDRRILKLSTKGGTMTFRARNPSERGSWLLLIMKQAALIKEQNILMQAEHIVANTEFQRSTRQLSRLEAFESLPGILGAHETRDLFVQFLRGEHKALAMSTDSGQGASVDWWPQGLTPQALEACLADEGRRDDVDSNAWCFAEGALLARFRANPNVRRRLCRLAAGIE